MTIETTSQPVPVPFPRTFYVANGVELLERLAYYGMYIGLSNVSVHRRLDEFS